MVGIGSPTIKQELNSLSQAQTHNKNDTGTYRGPNLRRSLTNESSYSDSKELSSQVALSSRSSTSAFGSWGQDLKTSQIDTKNGNASSSYSNEKSRGERLLETIVTSGGVRLQPTRDVIQVCVKAICVLEAILRKKNDEPFSIVTSYFTKNIDVVVKCSKSPQAFLREKANKLSWQLSTVVLDRHLLAEDIMYMFLCYYCGFGNILAYWSNCMHFM
ncbi:unnamed protein product [Lactuca saligna]|uniref:Uncharacterized protein n=1 Tax=Lactuca saligna TaxID=75948 RepID=A0AA36A0U9_LACSI|nr:unnamed protein product [Lactuca saligna]